MNGKGYGELAGKFADGIIKGVGRLLLISALVCGLLGGLAVWGLPKVWVVLKPWLHTITG
jgi:hypothetical protein